MFKPTGNENRTVRLYVLLPPGIFTIMLAFRFLTNAATMFRRWDATRCRYRQNG
jgi:hypothetical protein